MTIEIDPLTGAPILSNQTKSKPTIEELEKILKKPDAQVTIEPDGSIKAQSGLENDNNTELLDLFNAQVEAIVKSKMIKIKDILKHKMDSQQLEQSMKQIESILLDWNY